MHHRCRAPSKAAANPPGLTSRAERQRWSPRLRRQRPSAWLVAFGVLCAAGVTLQTACAPDRQKADRPAGIDFYIQGQQLYRTGQRDAAIRALEHAVLVNPDLRMAQTLLGECYRAQGDYQRAAIHYEIASRLDPYTESNHYNLGVSYQFLGRLQEAAVAYLHALKLDPKDVRANMNLGLVYLALGKIDDSVTYLERATRLDPKSAAAWSNLGVALDARGSAVLAESTYRKALELDSNNVVTLQNLAQNLISQDKALEAITLMQQVLLRSDSPGAHKRYADALVLTKDYDKANKEYDIAIKADPRNPTWLNDKGFMLIKRYTDGLELDDSLRNTAVDLWKQSLKVNPNQPRVFEALKKWEKPGLFGT